MKTAIDWDAVEGSTLPTVNLERFNLGEYTLNLPVIPSGHFWKFVRTSPEAFRLELRKKSLLFDKKVDSVVVLPYHFINDSLDPIENIEKTVHTWWFCRLFLIQQEERKKRNRLDSLQGVATPAK